MATEIPLFNQGLAGQNGSGIPLGRPTFSESPRQMTYLCVQEAMEVEFLFGSGKNAPARSRARSHILLYCCRPDRVPPPVAQLLGSGNLTGIL